MTSTEIRSVRFVLASIWLITGLVVLAVYPKQDSMALLARAGFYGLSAAVALYGGALLDIALGVLSLCCNAKFAKWLWVTQACLIVVYSLIITIKLPEFLIHPFGPILKNLPILLLLWLIYRNDESKR